MAASHSMHACALLSSHHGQTGKTDEAKAAWTKAVALEQAIHNFLPYDVVSHTPPEGIKVLVGTSLLVL